MSASLWSLFSLPYKAGKEKHSHDYRTLPQSNLWHELCVSALIYLRQQDADTHEKKKKKQKKKHKHKLSEQIVMNEDTQLSTF